MLHFLLTKYFTFRRTGGDIRSQIMRYGCATIVTTSFQYAAYHLAIRFVTEQPNIALGIAGFVSLSLNFLIMKWGVFEHKRARSAIA
jgi:putative flippase GtrA